MVQRNMVQSNFSIQVLLLLTVFALVTAPAVFANSGKIDLNTATVEQLKGLPGIGEKTAEAIVKHRKEHGNFQSVDELLEIKGIGKKKLGKIRPLVTVGKPEG